MTALTNAQVTKIVNQILSTHPYKEEFVTSYYKRMVREMLRETVKLTQDTIRDNEAQEG